MLIDKNIKIKNNNDNNILFANEIMIKLYDLGLILIKYDKKKFNEYFFDDILLNRNKNNKSKIILNLK